MEKLEEKAKLFASKYKENFISNSLQADNDAYVAGIEVGFIHGQKEYEEKLRWIPVEEKLPEIKVGMWRTEKQYKVKLKSGEEKIAYLTESKFINNLLYFGESINNKQWIISDLYDNKCKSYIEVVSWRNIL